MVSYSDALKMMQGGEDRTGYADMIDTLGEPGDLLAQKRTEAEQRRSLMELLSSQGDGSTDNTSIVFNDNNDFGNGINLGTFDTDGLTQSQKHTVGDIFNPSYYGFNSDVDENSSIADLFDLDEANIYEGGTKLISNFLVGNPDLRSGGEDFTDYVTDNKARTAYNVAKNAGYFTPYFPLSLAAEGLDFAGIGPERFIEEGGFEPSPSSMDAVDDPVYSDALDSSGFFNQDSLDRQRQINDAFENGTEFPYWYNEMDHEGSIAGEYLADGGRVGMQQGGMPAPALLGVSSGSLGFGGGQQNMANFQDAMYRPPLNRPPMRGDPDFVSGPGFGMQPTPMPFPVGPFKPMPFQPSPMQTADFDFGDYLGGSDPFAADYDPYVNATGTEAYDQYGMGMTQEDIDKVFADVDKFSLAAQEAKRKAAEEAAAAAAQQQQMGGDGPGPGGNTTGSFQGNYGQGPGATVGGANQGGYGDGTGGACFEPNTLIEMENGSEKKIKDVQLGDFTKGGKVTGVLQFEPIDDIHEYKGVIVAGSHFVREGNEFIMVQDSPKSVKIDKIPVVYSLDTTNRRIFINNIEFADYNGDGIAKKFLNNAGMDLAGFDKEVLRQVEHRLI